MNIHFQNSWQLLPKIECSVESFEKLSGSLETLEPPLMAALLNACTWQVNFFVMILLNLDIYLERGTRGSGWRMTPNVLLSSLNHL